MFDKLPSSIIYSIISRLDILSMYNLTLSNKNIICDDRELFWKKIYITHFQNALEQKLWKSKSWEFNCLNLYTINKVIVKRQELSDKMEYFTYYKKQYKM